MKRLIPSLAAAALLAVVPPVATAPSPLSAFGSVAHAASEPETIVREIYDAYGPDSMPVEPYETYFSPELLQLWNKVEEGVGDDVEMGIDFDIFLDAQDTDEPTDIETSLKQAGKGKAKVAVSFTAFGDRKSMTYDFIASDAGWKIDNIAWGSDRPDLRALLAELLEQQKAP